MRVGTGKAEIKFPLNFFPSEGFTKVVSPLFIRAFVIGGQRGFALLSVEVTSLPEPEINCLRDILCTETSLTKDRCWVTVTHTFSAPHFLPPHLGSGEELQKRNTAFHESLTHSAKEAIAQALESMTEARLTFGNSESYINVNRDIESAEGWWVGNTGTGPSDKTLSVISAINSEGEPVALLMHYPVQSSIMDGSLLQDGGKSVTSDLAGKASSLLEEWYPRATAIFLMGAAGDQAPIKKARTVVIDQEKRMLEIDVQESGLEYIKELGNQLARNAVEAIDKAKPLEAAAPTKEHIIKSCCEVITVPAKQMKRDIKELKPTRMCEYLSEGEKDTTIEAVAVGEILLLGVKPELNCVTAQQIIKDSPYKHTLVLPMVNGGAKYMADQASYDRCTYEAMNSPFNKGAAEKLNQEAKAMLEQLYTN